MTAPFVSPSAALVARSLGPLLALATCGCGGAMPLLHGAHVEPEGIVAGGAGVSGQALVGEAATAITRARNASGGAPAASAPRATYDAGALAVAALAPGVAPWVGARVGLGGQNEAGLAYSGRSLRAEAWHAFEHERLALAAGIGGSAVLAHRDARSDLAGLDLAGVNGFGIDVPLLGGWRSAGGLLETWGGVRGGYERLGGAIGLAGASPTPWSATRLWAGGVAGLAMGFRHVFVVLELDAAYHRASASLGGADLIAKGVTLAPSGALQGRFLSARGREKEKFRNAF